MPVKNQAWKTDPFKLQKLMTDYAEEPDMKSYMACALQAATKAYQKLKTLHLLFL